MDQLRQDPSRIHLQWFAEEGNGDEGGALSEIVNDGSSEGDAAPAKDAPKEGEGKALQTPELPGFAAGLTKTLKGNAKAVEFVQRFKGLDEAILHGMDLESRIGGMVAIPGKDATPEQRAAFLKAAGLDVPDKAEDYDLEPDKGVTQDPAQIKEYKALAKDLGLSKAQAKELYRRAQETAKKEMAGFSATVKAEREAAMASLKKDYGDDFPVQMDNIRRAMTAYVPKELVADISRSTLGSNPGFLKFLAKIGEMAREDSASTPPGDHKGGRTAAEILYPKK